MKQGAQHDHYRIASTERSVSYIEKKELGNSGIFVCPISLGCMGFSHAMGIPVERDEAVRTLRTNTAMISSTRQNAISARLPMAASPTTKSLSVQRSKGCATK